MAKQKSAAAQERLQQIVDAAVEIINEEGYSGLSLQAVANRVGITQPGVIHYVGSKKGLLQEIIEYYYDAQDGTDEYLALFEAGQLFEGKKPKLPEYLRLIVEQNAGRPELVMLFQVLNTEALAEQPDARLLRRAFAQGVEPAHRLVRARRGGRRAHGVVRARSDVRPRGPLARASRRDRLHGRVGQMGRRPLPLPLWDGYR